LYHTGRVFERVRHDVTFEGNARPSFTRHFAPQIELTPEERAESAALAAKIAARLDPRPQTN
jgi:hypothetical protein